MSLRAPKRDGYMTRQQLEELASAAEFFARHVERELRPVAELLAHFEKSAEPYMRSIAAFEASLAEWLRPLLEQQRQWERVLHDTNIDRLLEELRSPPSYLVEPPYVPPPPPALPPPAALDSELLDPASDDADLEREMFLDELAERVADKLEKRLRGPRPLPRSARIKGFSKN